MAAKGATDGSDAARDAWANRSNPGKYDPLDKWETFPKDTGLGVDTLWILAHEADPETTTDLRGYFARKVFGEIWDPGATGKSNGILGTRLDTLAGKTPQPREFIVNDIGFFPTGKLTLFTGAGAVGKTLVLLQLCIACASAGGKWLGHDVKHGAAVFFSAEEDEDELHRRCADICQADAIDMARLGSMRLIDMTGGSPVLLSPPQADRTQLVDTGLLQRLEKTIIADKPVLVVIDNRAQVVRGSEIDRNVATEAVNRLQRMARQHGTTIILVAHPSLTGVANKTGTSGSTGWVNTGRGQIDMVKSDDLGGGPDDGRRSLINRKANYSPMGGVIELVWRQGRYEVVPAPNTLPAGASSQMREAHADRIVVDLLERWRNAVCTSRRAEPPNYVLSVLTKEPSGKSLGPKAIRTRSTGSSNRGA